MSFKYPVGEEKFNNPDNMLDGHKYFDLKVSLNILSDLIGVKLNVSISNKDEFYDFINNPSKYINDQDICNNILQLKDLINFLGDDNYAIR